MPQTTVSQQKQKKMLILLFGCIVLRTQRKGEDILQALKLSFNWNFLIKTKRFGQTLPGRCTFAHRVLPCHEHAH